MKCKVRSRGIQFLYPLGPEGPYQILRTYVIEAEDGRIDTIEEWNESELPDGEYDFSPETLDTIFNKNVTIGEEEW